MRGKCRRNINVACLIDRMATIAQMTCTEMAELRLLQMSIISRPTAESIQSRLPMISSAIGTTSVSSSASRPPQSLSVAKSLRASRSQGRVIGSSKELYRLEELKIYTSQLSRAPTPKTVASSSRSDAGRPFPHPRKVDRLCTRPTRLLPSESCRQRPARATRRSRRSPRCW